MQFAFDPADIQATGVGIAAFIAIVLTIFVYLSARKEPLGRPMWIMLGACSLWALFGFFYHVIPDLWLAREMRVISVMGIVCISMSEVNFAIAYLRERVDIGSFARTARALIFTGGVLLLGILLADLAGARLIVGDLILPTNLVLAPNAGPLMALLIGYYAASTALSGILLAQRVRASLSESERRQTMLLFASMTVGLTLGGLRFTPWYGFDFYPIIGDLGFPLFGFAALYSITRYRLLNLEVAAAQVLIFVLWTFTFFRILLDHTLREAIPDIGLFVTVLILGIFLLRSVITEMRAQRLLAQLTIDQAKSEFVTIAAHQLRTPLSAARWTMDLLKSDEGLSQESKGIVAEGSRALENMMLIVNDLLDVARMGNGVLKYDMTAGDFRSIVESAVSLLSASAESKHIALSLHVPDAPLMGVFDREKLTMALENLVDNAIKYTQEGGRVDVSLEGEDGSVRFTISDTGIGVAGEDQSHLFERFYRGAAARRMLPDGSGLGLYIVRTIVSRHRGTVSLVSGEHGGAVATIDLPIAVV